MKFTDWYVKFIQDKVEVATTPHASDHAIHSKQLFVCHANRSFWEIGRTYTDRLVIRSGLIGQDGITIDWQPWQTLHDIEIPASRTTAD
jgi:hypothetical protein